MTTDIESRSLTLSKFDFQGKPHIFYDDHLQLLRRSDCFVARKIWPRATSSTASFLTNGPQGRRAAWPNPGKIDRCSFKASNAGRGAAPGSTCRAASRTPAGRTGDRRALFGLRRLLRAVRGLRPLARHGARATACTAISSAPTAPSSPMASDEFNGGLSDIATLRDYNPAAFLTNLVWNTRGERQCFDFGPADTQAIARFIASDPNAHVSAVSGAWLVSLLRSGLPVADRRRRAAELQAVEAAHLDILRNAGTKARVRIWTLAEFLEVPAEVLRIVQDDLAGPEGHPFVSAPRMVDLTGLPEFLQSLRNEGMLPHVAGDLSRLPDVPEALAALPRALR
jgi:hypothetical protein